MKSRGARALSESERDCKAYALARAYLLARRAEGITEELLEHYVRPPRASLTPQTMGGVFQRLLVSARNRNMMAAVIPDAVVDSLGPVLGGFDPVSVTTRFASPDQLLDTIIREVKPAGKLRRSRAGLWPVFSRATLSGARFLSQFADGAEFLAWVQTFDDDSRKRAALPLLLSQEVNGFGFALACDFLKELGFFNFAKPTWTRRSGWSEAAISTTTDHLDGTVGSQRIGINSFKTHRVRSPRHNIHMEPTRGLSSAIMPPRRAAHFARETAASGPASRVQWRASQGR